MMKRVIGILFASLLLAGCVDSTPKITKDNALEVAQDDANADEGSCQNISVTKGNDFYKIKFDTDAGTYTYKISFSGVIQKREYKKFGDEKEPQSESTPSTPSTETSTSSSDAKKETKSEFDANQEQAIEAALVNVGQTREDVSELSCTLSEDQSQYIVQFKVLDTSNIVYVDAASFAVVSTVTGGGE